MVRFSEKAMKKVIAISLVVLLVACLVAGVGWQVYRRLPADQQEAGRRRAPAVAVEAAPAVITTLRDIAEFTGTLLPDSQFTVAPKVAGRLEKLMVNIGDDVHNGDLVAVLDSAEYAQMVAQAQAELAVSNANLADSRSALDVKEREYERAKELRDQKVYSESDLDKAQSEYEAAKAKYAVAEAQIDQKQAELKAAQVRLSYTRIQAAWEDKSGSVRKVAERFVDEGSMLKANDPIVTIVDLSDVVAVVNVIERDYPDVHVGQAATITTDAHPGKEFTGHVVRMAPVLVEASRQARVEIQVPNGDELLAPGMFVRVRIEFAEHPKVLAVPEVALVRREDKQGVFVVNTADSTVQFVPVSTGISSGGLVEVTSGRISGPVVTLGQHLLEDGASVIVHNMSITSRVQSELVDYASVVLGNTATSSAPAENSAGGSDKERP
jgi:RND family efflux transporter MFP subunit